MNLKQLDAIYKIYKFEQKPTGVESVRAYTYTSGYFNNADIIPLSDASKDAVETVKAQFESLGYSTAIRTFASEEEADNALFQGFFNVEHHKRLLEDSYKDYCDRCSHAIEGEYKYIPSSFLKLNGTKEPKNDVIAEIRSCIALSSPQMIVVEAPAGFGKTTTINELIHSLCAGNFKQIPFVAELSRNRQAQIFKYVLLDELDRQFPALKLDLVTHHIQKGNIILIIDGFDELLTKTDYNNNDSVLIAAEPMLETISQLLSGNAKVILTTRKTAIFSGDYFHEWIDRHSDKFTVTRFEICEPHAREWLSEERLNAVKAKGLDLESVPNPVLLAWLRARRDEEFTALVNDNDADGLIDKYFDRLLEREKGRQKLYISPKVQKEIFIGLARYFAENDISSEQKEYLSLFLSEKYGGILEDIAMTYPPDEKLTEELLVDKLTNHVFLDRKVASSLGFVNDFFFGYFLGEYILNFEESDWEGSAKFIELASSSFRGRSEANRNALWSKLNTIIDLQRSDLKLNADLSLKKSICRPFKYEVFEESSYSGLKFGDGYIIESTLFNNCDFCGCTIYLNSIQKTNFIRCRFFECEFVGSFDLTIFPGCQFSPEIMLPAPIAEDAPAETFTEWELHVLRKFWPDGQARMFVRRKISTLKMGTSVSNGELVDSAITNLRKRGFLHIEENTAVCEISQINNIRLALGR